MLNNINSKKSFGLQWHITALCDQNCLHCYAKDEKTYYGELNNPLDFSNCKKIIDDLCSFCKKINAQPYINFTGGDPLLRKDFFKILDYANKRNILCTILGNPHHLTNINLKKLKENKLKSYQISLDGLQKKHDTLRSKGSFKKSLDAIKKLKKYGITTVVMFTISKKNSSDLLKVMKLVGKLGVDVFAFARVCGFGSGKEISKDEFKPLEYRKILLSAYLEAKKLNAFGYKTKYNYKDHLYTLLFKELGIFEPNLKLVEKDIIYSGCSIGCKSLSILADGTVFACRRLYSPIGKIPFQKIEDVFLSKKLDKYRFADYKKCSKCELYQFCRGCPAVAFGKTGKFGSPDPQCWH